ncbi:integral membrane protein 2B [Neocloeon triangulifer]|uniref:integral membrane protein 2B n=1 Tax=Neocloeon triangulifer TaxID=2078957 RepID=UPI00286ED449|nr:integral membrane protein 2B [Neocloeon triangulifer]
MTIITKPFSEKKKLEQPLVINEHDQDVESVVVPGNYHKRNSWVLLLAALMFLSFGIIGCTFIYRSVNRDTSFRAWCHVPYGLSTENAVASRNTFDEEFEIDEARNTASIRVPDFSGGRDARFIHDFNANMTGIIDTTRNRCFVMPLDRKVIVPPTDMIDLINKMFKGYYDIDIGRIRQRMQVVTPAVTNFKPLGEYITRECYGRSTYMLAKYHNLLYKRSADASSDLYTEFAGPNLQQIDIVNMAAVEEYEKQQQAAVAELQV